MPSRLFAPRPRGLSQDALIEAPASGPSSGGLEGRGLEAAALLCFAVSLFLALSLVSLSFDPRDAAVHGADWMGPVGAELGTFLVRGFGFVAWLFPIELVVLGAPLFKRRRPSSLGLYIAGDLVVAIIVAALTQVAVPGVLVFGQAPAAGNVGVLFGELMRGLFSGLGSFVVGLTVVGLILIGRSSFSFIVWSQRALHLFNLVVAWLAAVSNRLALAWSEARKIRTEQREAQRKRDEPRIDTQSDEAIIVELTEEPLDFDLTGPVPVALSERLRGGESFGALLSEASVTPAAPAPVAKDDAPVATEAAADAEPELEDESPNPPSPAPPVAVVPSVAAAAAKPAKEPRSKVPPGPRIVDTQPQTLVVPAVAPERARRRDRFVLPSADLLDKSETEQTHVDRERLLEQAQRLERTLADYGVTGKVEEIHPGPTVTTFEFAPEAGTKVSRVASLSDDLALGLSRKVRIIAPIPGKNRIGFELPNDERSQVNLRELIEDKRFADLAERAALPVVLGRDIVGAPFYADLAAMPHVIVAGATGAGKSVGLNVILASLLFKRSPDDLRLLMVDPKVVELAPFDGIPHLLLPVVTDMKQAATALRWAVDEMERRYQLFANAGTKNITTYNQWVARVAAGEIPAPEQATVEALGADGSVVTVPVAKEGTDGKILPGKIPFIVIVVDEFADLMMQQGKEVEAGIARLAQKARAAGMHVVLATQRPSVDVITGMIKANFPTRVAYRVAQKVDSRTILDEQGAEVLLGRGDMLVKMNGANDVRRVQCPFVSEEEVARLTDYLRAQGSPQYHDAILLRNDDEDDEAEDADSTDARFDEAVRIVADTKRCSTSWLQRKMTIGYNRAAKIVEAMEKRGMVGPPNGARDREVFMSAQ